MCRQFYRYCRDCNELFRMTEPDMREPCDAFEDSPAITPFLKTCLWEVQVIRPPSGHGAKVCEPCRKWNANEQRKRENAQKRARRAKLKHDRMTAGIGPGNVVWTPHHTPQHTQIHSFVNAQISALHSPQTPQRKTRPRGPKILSVRSMTRAHRQYEVNSGINTATIPQRQINISQLERKAHLESRQLFTPSTPGTLQPQEHGYDTITTEFRKETQLHRQCVPQYPPTPNSDGHPTTSADTSLPNPVPASNLDRPLYQEQQDPPIGLGIELDFTKQQHPPVGKPDTKQEQNDTQTSFFDEWRFRMELTEWSTVFEEDDDPEDSKEH